MASRRGSPHRRKRPPRLPATPGRTAAELAPQRPCSGRERAWVQESTTVRESAAAGRCGWNTAAERISCRAHGKAGKRPAARPAMRHTGRCAKSGGNAKPRPTDTRPAGAGGVVSRGLSSARRRGGSRDVRRSAARLRWRVVLLAPSSPGRPTVFPGQVRGAVARREGRLRTAEAPFGYPCPPVPGGGSCLPFRLPGPRGAGPARRARSAGGNSVAGMGIVEDQEWSAVLHGTTPRERRKNGRMGRQNKAHMWVNAEATAVPPPTTKATAARTTAVETVAMSRPMRMISPCWGTEK